MPQVNLDDDEDEKDDLKPVKGKQEDSSSIQNEDDGESDFVQNDEDEKEAAKVLENKDQSAKAAPESEGGDEEEEEDDERLGTDEEGTDVRADQRRSKRERRKLARQRDKDTIAFLMSRVANLEEALGTVGQNSLRSEISVTEGKINEVVARYKAAEEQMAKAIEESDGAKHNDALKRRDSAFRELARLDAHRTSLLKSMGLDQDGKPIPGNRRMEAKPGSAPQEKTRPVVPPAVRDNFDRWVADKPWYDVNQGNEASRIAYVVDLQVLNDGYNPADPEYWQELDRRLAVRLPEKYGNKKSMATKVRRGPPVAGSGSDSSSNAPSAITRERVKAMKEAGVWDDPETRKRVLARYKQFDRQNARS